MVVGDVVSVQLVGGNWWDRALPILVKAVSVAFGWTVWDRSGAMTHIQNQNPLAGPLGMPEPVTPMPDDLRPFAWMESEQPKRVLLSSRGAVRP